MDDGYSRLILLAGVVLLFLAAGFAIWKFIKVQEQENVTEEDIMDMVSEAMEAGRTGSSEAEMITNIFEFDDKEASDIMTHRKNIVALDGSMTLREAAHFVLKEAKNSRYRSTEKIWTTSSVPYICGMCCFMQKICRNHAWRLPMYRAFCGRRISFGDPQYQFSIQRDAVPEDPWKS